MFSREKIAVSFAVMGSLLAGCATESTTPPADMPTAPAAAAAADSAAMVKTPEAMPAAPAATAPLPPNMATKSATEPAPPKAAAKVSPPPAAPAAVPSSVPTAPAPAATAPAAAAPKVVKPKDPNTFIITSMVKDKSHPFFGQGFAEGFAVNGEQGKSVVLTRGGTYTFDVDTGVKHDFYFTTSAAGWGAGTYTEGIEGQFTYKGAVTFKTGSTTPNNLFYGCRNHKFMGGKIYVVNKGETVKIDDKPAAGAAASASAAKKVTVQQVQPKLAYAEQLIVTSPTAKRLASTSNAEASSLYKQSQESLKGAKAALSAGDAPKAMDSVNEALRLVNSAAMLVPAETAAADANYKGDYEQMHRETKGYFNTYKKTKEKSGDKMKAKLDEAKFNKLLGDAEAAASKGDYQTAIGPMKEASAMITQTVSVLLNDTTLVYETEFATPKEEYEYELARYESYLELVPIAIEQKQPTPQQVASMDEFVNKAKKIVEEGKAVAAKGDYKLAIQAMEAATDNVRRALMTAGVR